MKIVGTIYQYNRDKEELIINRDGDEDDKVMLLDIVTAPGINIGFEKLDKLLKEANEKETQVEIEFDVNPFCSEVVLVSSVKILKIGGKEAT